MEKNPTLAGLTVLYVEDEPVARLSITAFLKRWVGTLYTAENGQQGLELFAAHRPQVVITDLEMPVMNGLEMIKKIRDMDNGTPIIITTAYDDEAHRCDLANRVILKPIVFNDLLDQVTECVEERR
ncbi:MAG: response regulator [Trichlorobacter sp.]|jgi:CheY-like chemotaxis protein|nr:response regulator [Trichlorobacter sp.]